MSITGKLFLHMFLGFKALDHFSLSPSYLGFWALLPYTTFPQDLWPSSQLERAQINTGTSQNWDGSYLEHHRKHLHHWTYACTGTKIYKLWDLTHHPWVQIILRAFNRRSLVTFICCSQLCPTSVSRSSSRRWAMWSIN